MNADEPSALKRARFWEHVPLEEMSSAQWESLCDGCARCCLLKFEEQDTGEVVYTRVACKLLDLRRCRCKQYAARQTLVGDCAVITPSDARSLPWLPRTCAYRTLAEGRPLEPWHPLISGDPMSVHRAGISVRGKVVSERDVHPSDVETQVINWVEQ